MGVEVGVLGPTVAWRDGTAVELGGPGERAVLARLAMAPGQVVPTDRLLDELWDGHPGPGALSSLQARISRLRRVLEPDRPPRTPARVLVSAAPGYVLHAGDVDADRFVRAIAPGASVAALRDALAMWRGPAYAEVADLPWAMAEAGRLDDLRRVARERLATALLDAGDADTAVTELERHVAEHPLREEAVRLLALALYRAGRTPEALDALRGARRRLADELGLDAGPAIDELEAAVLRHDAVLAARPPTAPAPVLAVPALVGREVEMARLHAVAERVAAGRGPELAVVTGEAGAGKSSVLAALRADRAAAGWTCVHGRCPEVDGAPPAWAWTEIARELPGTEDGDGVDATPFRRGQLLITALEQAAAGTPVLVTLDDLHRADDETLRLLRMVAGTVPGRILVVTARRPHPDEPAPDASQPGEPDAVEAAFAGLAARITERIDLGGLSVDAIMALCADQGVAVDHEQAREARERTGGNPLFVREVIRLAERDGPDAARSSVPAGVREVLRRRVAGLPPGARTVLAHAALFGREVDVGVLLAFEQARVEAGAEPAADLEDDLDDALTLAESGGVLVAAGPARVGFAHDLWREVLVEDLPRLRRARLHATALDVLEAAPGRAGSVHEASARTAALAHHALAATGRIPVERLLGHVRAAAADAVERGAYRQGAQLWGQARDVALDAGLPPREVVAIQNRRIAALARAGASAASSAECDDALARARPLGDPSLLADVLTAPDGPAPWPDKMRAGLLQPVFDELLDGAAAGTWTPTAEQWVRLYAGSATDAEERDQARADAHSREAVERARALEQATGATRPLCAALDARYLGSGDPDAWHRLPAIGAEMLEAATRGGHEDYRVESHHVFFTAANLREDLAAAEGHVRAALTGASAGQLETTLAYVGCFRASVAVAEGRLDEADALYVRETDRLDAAGAPNAWPERVTGAFAVAWARGDLAPLVGTVGELYAMFPDRVGDQYALCLLDAGDPVRAREVWRPHVPPWRDWTWTGWATLRGEVAVGLGDRDVAASVYAALTPWTGHGTFSGSGALVLGPVDYTLARLARLLDRSPQECLAHLDAAARVAERYPPWRERIVAERRAWGVGVRG